MLRDALLLDWVQRCTPDDVTWLDFGAGDGSVSRAIRALRPKGTGSCWDIKPRQPDVRRLRQWTFPAERVDFTLFNFVLHHLGSEGQIDRCIAKAFRQSQYVVIQEDIDDGTPETRAKLRKHDHSGFYLSIDVWLLKLNRLCVGAQFEVFPHPQFVTDTQGYNVPRAMFVVHDGQSATSGGPQVPQPFATKISSSVGSTGSQAS